MKYKLCPKCKVQLHWVLAIPEDPYSNEHYICPKCDGTYNIEDISSYLIVDNLPDDSLISFRKRFFDCVQFTNLAPFYI